LFWASVQKPHKPKKSFITSTSEYTFLSFLSSIGGDLSLYIGMTILSFVEIGEFVIRLLISSFKKKNF
jgi:hypothetical protein